MRIGLSQQPATVSFYEALENIQLAVSISKGLTIDTLIFPELGGIGYSPKMAEFKRDNYKFFLEKLRGLASKEKINLFVGLPSFHDGQFFNSYFLFRVDGSFEELKKAFLTEPEKKVFSPGPLLQNRIFTVGKVSFQILICKELSELSLDENVDFIVHPSFWGWEKPFTTDDRYNETFFSLVSNIKSRLLHVNYSSASFATFPPFISLGNTMVMNRDILDRIEKSDPHPILYFDYESKVIRNLNTYFFPK